MTVPLPPTGDLSCEEIQDATGCPAANILAIWPLVLRYMRQQGVASLRSQIGMAGTIATETPRFYPLAEGHADPVKQALVYAAQNRYWPSGFYGRGLIQTTWEANYRVLEARSGLPVVAQPALLLQPEPAAIAAAIYWKDHHVAEACDLGDWPKVRRLVNGGLNGWDRFHGVVSRLTARHDPPTLD